MRPLRLLPDAARPRLKAVLRDVAEFGGPSPLDEAAPAFRGRLEPGGSGGNGRFDLLAESSGLLIVPRGGHAPGTEHPEGPVPAPLPTLIPWDVLECSVGPEPVELADGGRAGVLVLGAADGTWLGTGRQLHFVVPDAQLGRFLAPSRSDRRRRRARGSWVGGLVGTVSAAIAALWTASSAPAVRWAHSLPLGSANGDPQHGQGHRRFGPVVVGLLALALLAGSTSLSLGSSATGIHHPATSTTVLGSAGNRQQAAAQSNAAVSLPAATVKPAPAPPSLAGEAPLQSHEIFGYAPYWTLPQSSGFDVKDLTTLAYFSVDANGDGSLDQSGPGWNGYESQDLANLVTRSHAAGDRVVLTVTCFSQTSLDEITSSPTAAATLSAALIAAVSAKNLDGVNFDFEGEGSADQVGLTRLITQVSDALHAANPHWQVTMATYASAAGDSGGFFNIAALAPALDGFFVMAYDMNNRSEPSATSPLIGGGFNDTEALQQFTAVVPASKVILGVPYYGYDWPTTAGTSGAQATGSESPLSDGVIAASGHPTYWDPTTDTAWTSYQVGTQWRETYFDDPTSLAMKAQLAQSFHIAGLGIWALGMDGNDPAMLSALLGNAPAAKDLSTGPTSTSSTGPAGTGFTTTGAWQGTAVPLTPVALPSSVGTPLYLGTLTNLSTTDPALACLQTGPPLTVWTYSTLPGVDVVSATQPQDCAAALWTFPPSAVPATTTTTTTAPPATTTTTTAAPTTTTTPPPTTSTTSPPTTTTTTTTSPPAAPIGTTP